ncbi:hypothetical protein TKWG_13720 [Advenella kashmirensis WT001]|uniref:Uncharacterized protein n=2 Tax=Advenella kashmirensis TaxID=310575 RepID=I3UCV5_ADVKW|nr:hypothetical protein TKWG_13720 [Advenella kashmirensis WT001]
MKVILHAPTASALERARNNATNLKREDPDAHVRIIANAQAVGAALDIVHEQLDSITWLCPISLDRAGRQNREPLQVLTGPAVLEMVRLQQDGWVYLRA